VLQTAYLKPYKPISLLLLGNAGIGKTRLLSPLAKLDFVSYVNDITPKYLVEFLHKVKNGEKRFLVVPDFTNCMSHAMNTRTVLVAILRSMTEEGVIDLSDYQRELPASPRDLEGNRVPVQAPAFLVQPFRKHQDQNHEGHRRKESRLFRISQALCCQAHT
jgi:hypothetical protein